MKCIVVDFVSISFSQFKVHGGGDFALRAVEFLISSKKSFYIINNSTEYFKEHSIYNESDLRNKLLDKEDVYYFNPLYQGGDNNLFNYAKKYLYIHGLRMLEMPYDTTSYKYFKFPGNITTWIKAIFLKNYYGKSGQSLLESVDNLKGEKVILTPSEHSKYMMKGTYPLKTPIIVLPPFIDTKLYNSHELLPTKNKYVLMLNGDRWVKNSYRFLTSFKSLKAQGELKGIDLVMVGIPKFSKEFTDDYIKYLDYVDRAFLEKLMKECYFLAYPSLNEGFGYPPLDCFKYGIPVLSTSLSSPNILYNGQVVFTNPYSIDEMKSRLLYLVDNYDNFKNVERNYKYMIDLIQKKWQQIF